jgi:hypothetical protein
MGVWSNSFFLRISTQVDLGTIRERCSTHFKYRTRHGFVCDLELMASNAADFNGSNHEIALEAARIVAFAKSALANDATALDALEVCRLRLAFFLLTEMDRLRGRKRMHFGGR